MNIPWTRWSAAAAVAAVWTVAMSAAVLAQEEPRDRDRASGGEDTKVLRAEPKVVPPHQLPQPEWRLGVTITPSDIGIQIREVLPQSPAARAGLEARDTIINVNGYQVGRVNGREYPLDVELQQRADHAGRVTLLVQDRRTDRLMHVPVTMERGPGNNQGVLRGIVEYRERMALPPGAVLRIAMQRRTFRGMETIAEETYRNLGQSPIPFEFHYPTQNVFPRETYYLSAEILQHGRRIFVSNEPYVLRMNQQPGEIRILLRRD